MGDGIYSDGVRIDEPIDRDGLAIGLAECKLEAEGGRPAIAFPLVRVKRRNRYFGG